MDIQIQNTPPKRTRPPIDYSTPPKNSHDQEQLCFTPEKPQPRAHNPQPQMQHLSKMTPPKQENPESKKFKMSGTSKKKHPHSNIKHESDKKISQFCLSRLEQDYQFVRPLGSGNFSNVALYRSRMSGDYFAIKKARLSSVSVNEAQALGSLSIFSQKSKNIIRYYHSWTEEQDLYIVMEYCNQNLTQLYRKCVMNGTYLDETTVKDILRQALTGLKCMHEHGMVHLDIKPDNLLVKQSVVKVSDLGLTRISKLKRQSDLEEGDSRYLAKQVLNYHEGVDLAKVDIYSLGLTIYEGLVLENLPNNGPEWTRLREHGLSLKTRMDLHNYTEELLEIVELMASPNPLLRPTADQVLKMRYFKQSMQRKNRMFLAGSNFNCEKKRKQRSSPDAKKQVSV